MAHSPTSNRIGEVIAAALDEAGITLRQAADKTLIARTTLARHLRFGGFTVEELEAIARLLGTTVSDLISRAEGRAA